MGNNIRVNVKHTWWCHQMETFSKLLVLCAGNSLVTGEFHSQRPVTQSFCVFNALRLNKRLSKQSLRRWFETPWCSLWHHCNEVKDVRQLSYEILRHRWWCVFCEPYFIMKYLGNDQSPYYCRHAVVRLKDCAHGLYFVVFCCGLLYFVVVWCLLFWQFQDYFTGRWAIL